MNGYHEEYLEVLAKPPQYVLMINRYPGEYSVGNERYTSNTR
jgi:hypothetical protein